jgi:alpha-L-rhamnosidase
VASIRIEHHAVPIGIGEPTPRLSWHMAVAPDGWRQEGYRLRSVDASGVSQTDWIESSGQHLVPWPFAPLASRARAAVSVQVRGADECASEWSDPVELEAGLLDPGDWVARAVAPDGPVPDEDLRRPPLLRHDFEVRAGLSSARLYVTGHGLVETELNGVQVGDHVLAPGWTVYPSRLVYDTYDVVDMLQVGPNAIGALLGDGWYRGRIGFDGGTRDIYGDRVALIAQLELTYLDGVREIVASGADWRSSVGAILSSSLYVGERCDARLEPRGWSSPGFDDSAWTPVIEVDRDPSTLVAPAGPPVRCTQEVDPVDVRRTSRGTYLLDFGQNLVGRLRIRVNGEPGTRVTLRHAEVLQDGELYVRPLRTAIAVDEYVLDDRGTQEWEPRFTIHGFRYAEVEGWPGELSAGDITARVIHSDMRRTGGFESSDPRLNRLHENVVWSMRGNFVGLPTDCPQRDERLGWTGDIQVFGPTATFLYDCAGILSSWLQDLALEQLPDGTVPWFVPTIYGNEIWSPPRPGAAWGDAAVIVPWTLYERYGDTEVLARQYPSAKAWVECIDRLAGDEHLWDSGFQLGDWLDPAAPPDDPGDGRTDRYLVATAYFARSTQLLARTAEVLGNTDDSARFNALADEIRDAFRRRYVAGPGRLTSDAATAYALAIAFDLLPSEAVVAAGARLDELVAAEGDRIATGFVGTPVILHALAATGHIDRAYALLMQAECPSWLYMVDQGATTIWERWDSMLPDGTVNPGGMTSFNHYALGAVADWLHSAVAGLSQASPVGDELSVRPRPGGGLSWAAAWLDTAFGRASVRWDRVDDVVVVQVDVPAGSRAHVDLGAGHVSVLGSGHHELRAPWSAVTRA